MPWRGAAATTQSSAVQRCFANCVVRGCRRGGGLWRWCGVVALLLFDFSLGTAAVSFPPCGVEPLAEFFLLGSFSWRGDGKVLLLPPSFSLLPLLV